MRFILSLLVIVACSYHHYPNNLGPFDPQEVCSPRSLSFYDSLDKVHTSEEVSAAISEKLKKLGPGVQSCFQAELDRNKKSKSAQICLVTAVDKTGKLEFFEFSNKNLKMTSDFWSCLQGLKSNFRYEPLKHFVVIQPFNLNIKF